MRLEVDVGRYERPELEPSPNERNVCSLKKRAQAILRLSFITRVPPSFAGQRDRLAESVADSALQCS